MSSRGAQRLQQYTGIVQSTLDELKGYAGRLDVITAKSDTQANIISDIRHQLSEMSDDFEPVGGTDGVARTIASTMSWRGEIETKLGSLEESQKQLDLRLTTLEASITQPLLDRLCSFEGVLTSIIDRLNKLDQPKTTKRKKKKEDVTEPLKDGTGVDV